MDAMRDVDASVQMQTRRLSAERKELRTLMFSREQEKALQFIKSVTGLKFSEIEKATSNEESAALLCEALSDGVVLCELVNILKPNAVPLILTSESTPIKFLRAYENINLYVAACRNMGLSDSELFAWDDLAKGANFRKVVHSIVALRDLVSSTVRLRPAVAPTASGDLSELDAASSGLMSPDRMFSPQHMAARQAMMSPAALRRYTMDAKHQANKGKAMLSPGAMRGVKGASVLRKCGVIQHWFQR